MLYEYEGRTFRLTLGEFFGVSDYELQKMCVRDNGCQVSSIQDPFYSSYLNEGDRDIEDPDDNEEWEDPHPEMDLTLSGLDLE